MRRKILLFVVQFVPIFALCLWLYPRVLPAVHGVIVPAIDLGLHRLDPPMRMELTDDGGWQTYQINPDGSEERYWYRPGLYLNLMLLGVALLPALLLATPVKLAHRLRLTGIGMLLLILVYIPAGLMLVLSVRCLASDPESVVCMWTKTSANMFGQLVSVAIWALLTWHIWLPSRAGTAGASR